MWHSPSHRYHLLNSHYNSAILFRITLLYFVIKEIKINWSQIESGKVGEKQDIPKPPNRYIIIHNIIRVIIKIGWLLEINPVQQSLFFCSPSSWKNTIKWIHVCKCFFLDKNQHQFSSVQFSRSVMSNSLWPHESQHARPPCLWPTPRVYSNSKINIEAINFRTSGNSITLLIPPAS